MRVLLDNLIKGEYTTTRWDVDDEGNICRLDVITPANEKGEATEYHFTLAGNFVAHSSLETIVHSVHYEKGEYAGTGRQATFADGAWVIEE